VKPGVELSAPRSLNGPLGVRRLLLGAGWVSLSIAIYQLAGLAFWGIAARRFDQDLVGDASSLIWLLYFLVFVGSLGFPIASARFGTDATSESRTIFGALVAYRMLATLVLSVPAIVALHLAAPSVLTSLGDRPFGDRGLLYLALVVAVCTSTQVDLRLLALRRPQLMVLRSGLVTVSRLVGVWLIPDNSSWAIFAVLIVPEAVSGLLGVAYLRPILSRPQTAAASGNLHEAMSYGLSNYLGLLAASGPLLMVSVVAVATLGSDARASFSLAWSLTSVAFLLPQALADALLVEGRRDGADLADQVATARAVAFATTIVAALACCAGPLVIPAILGADYRSTGLWLPLLVASAVPWSTTMLGVTKARVEGNQRAYIIAPLVFAIVSLVPTALAGLRFGLGGIAVAWWTGNAAAAVVAARVCGLAPLTLSRVVDGLRRGLGSMGHVSAHGR
jgi:O-antigen/teichoic acid export membrane protein